MMTNHFDSFIRCIYESTNGLLRERIDQFDENEFKKAISKIKEREQACVTSTESTANQNKRKRTNSVDNQERNVEINFEILKANYETTITNLQNSKDDLKRQVDYLQKENSDLQTQVANLTNALNMLNLMFAMNANTNV